MRRTLARVLLLVFSFGLIAPAMLLAAGDDSSEAKVPACCRKDGKHKCAMKTGPSRQLSSTSPSVSASRSRCPMYREIQSPPATDAYGFGVALSGFSFNLPAARAVQASSIALAVRSIHDSSAQRGPPSSPLAVL